MRDLDYGKGYEYSHDMPEGVSVHSFFPEKLGERRYYFPSPHGKEKEIGKRLKELKEKVKRLRSGRGEKD
jgi:putative ATPase